MLIPVIPHPEKIQKECNLSLRRMILESGLALQMPQTY